MFGQRKVDPSPGTHYRSERVSAVNGQYFFSTREGTLEGPFFTRIDAIHGIDIYIHRMQVANALYTRSAALTH